MKKTKAIKTRGDFFDFVINAQKDKELSEAFFGTREAKGLYNFFQANGYDISMETCEKSIEVKNSMIQGGMECYELCDIVLGGRGY